MKRKPPHIHSMLPRAYYKGDNYSEHALHQNPVSINLQTKPRINIKKKGHSYVLELDLSGFNNEDAQICIIDNKLYVRGLTRNLKTVSI